MNSKLLCLTVTISAFFHTGKAASEEFRVSETRALQEALGKVAAGDVILITPGDYHGGLRASRLRGDADRPITIKAADAAKPPRFRGGGNSAFQFSSCRHFVLSDLVCDGFGGNGINIDDSGDLKFPSEHIVLERLRIENTGPKGNRDALKLSGVYYFIVKNCQIAGWGGSGIDMVGCHHGVIEDCRFEGRKGFSQSNAVQMKGGSSHLVVRNCFFRDAGQRAINLGGSTGLKYFRPKAGAYEATDIEVVGNRFVGGMAPVAWVGSKGGNVHHNTIYLPEKWVGRILQENTAEQFKPCSRGQFNNNLILYDRRVRVFFNIGGKTDPDSFSFKENAWFQVDGDSPRPPQLPSAEKDGVYQIDPKLEKAGTPEMRVTNSDESLKGKGAEGSK